MADNIPITPGSGLVVGTDDVDGVQYQRVKIVKGADGKLASDPLHAFTTATVSGNTVIVGAVTGKQIRVLSVLVSSETAVTVKFQSGTTDITAPKYVEAKGGFAYSCESGVFQTALGIQLNINLSANANVGCDITYVTE